VGNNSVVVAGISLDISQQVMLVYAFSGTFYITFIIQEIVCYPKLIAERLAVSLISHGIKYEFSVPLLVCILCQCLLGSSTMQGQYEFIHGMFKTHINSTLLILKYTVFCRLPRWRVGCQDARIRTGCPRS
jgi:hypothetical protein